MQILRPQPSPTDSETLGQTAPVGPWNLLTMFPGEPGAAYTDERKVLELISVSFCTMPGPVLNKYSYLLLTGTLCGR